MFLREIKVLQEKTYPDGSVYYAEFTIYEGNSGKETERIFCDLMDQFDKSSEDVDEGIYGT